MLTMRRRTTAVAAATGLAIMIVSATVKAEAPVEPQAKPKFQSVATPPTRSAGIRENVTCYFRNVSNSLIELRDVSLAQFSEPVEIGSNTCGDLKSFRLPAKSTCFVGGKPFNSLLTCAARVSDPASLRGSLEIRDGNGKVQLSSTLSAGTSQKAGDDFETIASAPAFGSPDQKTALCYFFNAGKETAKIKNVTVSNSLGQTFDLDDKYCTDSGSGKILPGGTCRFIFRPIAVTDIQCTAQVTRKADIRGMLYLIDSPTTVGEVLNRQPLD